MLYEGRPANGDLTFRFDKLAVHADSQTARLAVLWPIADLHIVSDVDTQLKAAKLALNKWREALVALRDNHWKAIEAHKAAFQRLRNCYPSSVLQSDDIKTQPCQQRDICPWCYGRWVSDIYNSITKAKTCDEQLITLFGNAYEPILGPQARSLREALDDYRTGVSGLLNQRRNKYKGIVWSVMVEPRAPQWHFTARAIVLAPLGTKVLWLPDKWAINIYERPSCDDIKNAVSKIFRYPVMMLKADANLVVEILHARSRLRLTETCGVFRKKLVREQKNANDLHLYAGADGSARSANSA